MIGGIIFASLGTASIIGGGVMIDQANQHPTSCGERLCFNHLNSEILLRAGVQLTFIGGLAVASGVAMAISGGWQVPVATGGTVSLLGGPKVAVGPGTATVGWSF